MQRKAPAAETAPGAHGMHDVAPVVFEYWPARQSWQAEAGLPSSSYFPIGHLMQTSLIEVAPTAKNVLPENVPGEQGVHETSDVAPVVCVYWPAGQPWQAVAGLPSSSYFPIGHLVQTALIEVAPALAEYSPPEAHGTDRHLTAPTVFENRPIGQY
jgi:hypothetical protein